MRSKPAQYQTVSRVKIQKADFARLPNNPSTPPTHMLSLLPLLSTSFSLGRPLTVSRTATSTSTPVRCHLDTLTMQHTAALDSDSSYGAAAASAAATAAARLLELKTDDELTAILASGSPAVVLFAAKWCPACRRVEARMKRLARGRRGVSFLVVHHNKLTSDLFASHGIDQLPHLKTFDENGMQVGDVLIEKAYEFEKYADEEIRRLRGFSP